MKIKIIDEDTIEILPLKKTVKKQSKPMDKLVSMPDKNRKHWWQI